MLTSPIAFEFTSQFRDWLNSIKLSGPCTVYDCWTYGRILVEPRQMNWLESGQPKSAIGYSWRTIN